MGYNIQVDWDTANGLMKAILKEDYETLVKDTKDESLHEEDRENSKRFAAALEVVFEYYFTDSERREIFGG